MTFKPTASGTRTGTLNIPGATGGGTVAISLSGIGTYLSASPSSLGFGSQLINTTSSAQMVTLTSNAPSGVTTNLGAITISGDFSQTNTCGSSLSGGATCTISVSFTPTAASLRTGTLSIPDTSGGATIAVPLSGFGLWLTITPGNLSFGPQLVNTTSAVQVLTLKNVSSVSQNPAISVSGSSFAQTNNCGSSLATGATCTANITFTPTGVGSQTGTFYGGGGFLPSPPSVASLSGIGTYLSTSPSSLTFATQQVNTTSSAQSVTLKSNVPLGTNALGTITISGDFTQTNTCGSSLNGGATCTISVTFTPTASGTRTGSLSIPDATGGGTLSVLLSGTGSAAALSIPSSFAFNIADYAGTVIAQALLIQNVGTQSISINAENTTGDFGVEQVADSNIANQCPLTLPFSLNAGQACNIGLTFKASALGTRTGVLTVTDALPETDTTNLSGTGVSPISLSRGNQPSPNSWDFGNQILGQTGPPEYVTVTNNGKVKLTISGSLTAGVGGTMAQSSDCSTKYPGGLPYNRFCSFSVTFTPSALGTSTATLTISSNQPGQVTASLTGNGVNPVIAPVQASIAPFQTTQFSTTVSNPIWSVDGTVGGSAAVGFINTTGLYSPTSTTAIASHTISVQGSTAVATVFVTNYSGTLTYHNDNQRTGTNGSETVLSAGNVNSSHLGKLFSQVVDGSIFAQPLYAADVNLPGNGVHNVVYVTTENDSLYAFDADNWSSAPLWKVSFLQDPPCPSGATCTPVSDTANGTVGPVQGITGTPVIDPQSQTLYVVSYRDEFTNSSACPTDTAKCHFYRLHAIDMTTGTERPSSPVIITDAANTFDPSRAFQRPALLLANGNIYVGFASQAYEAIKSYNGWLFAYNSQSLAQVGSFNTTAADEGGGIWGSGGAIAADTSGNIFITTGNGDSSGTTGIGYYECHLPSLGISPPFSYCNAVVKLSPTLSVLDYFIPFNEAAENQNDRDLGAGGIVLFDVPSATNPHLAILHEKLSQMYLMNRDNLGQFGGTGCAYDQNNIIVCTGSDNTAEVLAADGQACWCVPAVWQSNVYFQFGGQYLRQYQVQSSGLLLLNTDGTPKFTDSSLSGVGVFDRTPLIRGGAPSISASGNSGIVWVLDHNGYVDGYPSTANPATLYAFDASNISTELYDTKQSGARDLPGGPTKFSTPTVANGKVYVGTATELDVYGLLPQ